MESQSRYAHEIDHCIECLEKVQTKNAVAKQAVKVLRHMVAQEESHS